MASKLRDVLSRIVDELDDEETRDAFEELRSRKVSTSDILEAVKNAPPEERAQLREILREEEVIDDGGGPPPKTEDKPPKPPKGKKGDAPPRPEHKTRPGRKSGGAYDWDVDPETGEPVRVPMAIVYSGEDEPDEVHILPASPKPEEEEEEAAAE